MGNVLATVLDCSFEEKFSVWGLHLACIASNFKTQLNNRTISEMTGGNSQSGKATELFVKKQYCPYLPLNVSSIFKSLEILYIMNSHVQNLLEGDLDGLTSLRVFDVSHNPIEILSKDFFKGAASIEIVSFFDCHLKKIEPTALSHLPKLQGGRFQTNVCIDYAVYEPSELEILTSMIRSQCSGEGFDITNNSHQKTCEPLPFIKKNAILIVSFLTISLIFLVIILTKIMRKTFKNNWDELKMSLL